MVSRGTPGFVSGILLIVSVALVVGLVVAGVIFMLTRHNGQAWALRSAERVIAEQAETQSRLFEDIRIDHEAADTVLMQRFAALEGIDVDRAFDRLFPLRGDGTRRSAPEFYDGYRTDGGAYVEGMGAFIQRGETLSEAEKRLLIAAFQTVHEFGAGMRGRVDNFYFFTPGNSLVIYAPTRDDRLEFYRETAPADFDLQALEFAAMMRPENNATGVMACTGLENVVYQRGGPSVSSACGSPVRARGEHLGAFGNSIYLHTWLTQAVIEAPEGTTSFVLDANGDVIAHQSLMTLDTLTPEAIATANAEVNASDIRSTIMDDGRDHGALIHNGQVVSFVQIDAPGWYYVNVRPATAIVARALRFSVLAGAIAALMILIGAFGLAATALRLRTHAARAMASLFEDARGDEEPALR